LTDGNHGNMNVDAFSPRCSAEPVAPGCRDSQSARLAELDGPVNSERTPNLWIDDREFVASALVPTARS
jgi:hypothetical protein